MSSDFAITPKEDFYVYHLVEPRNQEVFYIGKGRANRARQHVSAAINFVGENIQKEMRIRTILHAGFHPIIIRIAEKLTETAAYKAERESIARFGIHNLTNICSGSTSYHERQILGAKASLERIKPFHVWYAEAPIKPTKAQCDLYRRVVRELRNIATGRFMRLCMQYGLN